MKNNFLLKLLLVFLMGLGVSQAQNIPLEPGYTDYDKHKAVITCMQYIYINQYKDFPADNDMFPVCEQRFLALSRQLSHEQFVKQRAEQGEHHQQHTFNTYYDVLFGIPPDDLNDTSTPSH